MTDGKHSQGLFGRVTAAWRRFRKDRRANVAVIFALALVPTLGVFGLGSEGSYWLLTQRAEQNAADAAVMAAAQAGQADFGYNTTSGTTNGCSSCYAYEGNAVATNYGFTTGTNNTTVAVANNVTCPSDVPSSITTGLGSTNICYKVTITKTVPLYFVRAVGYRGTNGSGSQTIRAVAYAGPKNEPIPVCILALGNGSGTANNAITLNGNPKADLGNCTIFSDQSAKCTGHNSGAFVGGAVGTDDPNNPCGDTYYSGATAISDPDAAKASNIPSNPCSKYQQESPQGGSTDTTGQITIPSGSYSASALVTAINSTANSSGGSGFAYSTTDATGDPVAEVCGDLRISSSGNVTISSGNAIIVMENGTLDLNGNGLITSGTAGATVIFQNQGAANTNSSTPYFTGVNNGNVGTNGSCTGSCVNISSPTSGTWSGVTVYDPAASGNYQYKGNAPAWTLSGIVYFPNTDIDWRGIVGKATNGFQCFDMVVRTLSIQGTAQMFNPDLSDPTSQCSQQGAPPPTTNIGYRYVLVQ